MKISEKGVLDIVLVALVLAYFVFFVSFYNIDSTWPDESLYAYYGEQFLQDPSTILNREISSHSAYVMVLLTAGFSIFVSGLTAAKIVSFLAGLGVVLGTYFLGKEVYDARVGVIAAAMVLFSPVFLEMSLRGLRDLPLTFAFVLASLAFVRFHKDRSYKNAIMVGLTIAFALSLKIAGVLLVVALGMFYVLEHRFATVNLLKDRSFQLLFFALLVSFTPVLLLNLISQGSLIPESYTSPSSISAYTPVIKSVFDPSSLEGVVGKYLSFFPTYFFEAWPFMLSAFLVPFFVLALFGSFKSKNFFDRFVLLLFGLFAVFFTLVVVKDYRHLLPVLPFVSLITASFLDKKIFRLTSSVLVIFLVFVFLTQVFVSSYYVSYHANFFTGYQEAGRLISELPPGTVVLANGFDNLRYFSHNKGISYFSIPRSPDAFRKVVEENDKVVLVVDAWEPYQPEYVFPLTADNYIGLQELGFSPLYVVSRPYVDITSGTLDKDKTVISLLKKGF